MAGLTRKFIKDAAKDAGVELPAEMIDAIIGAHVESRDAAIETAVKPLNEQLEAEKGKSGTDEFKTKWEQEHADFEQYKNEVEAEKLATKKQAAVKALLAELKISDKRHDVVMRATDLTEVDLDDKGQIKNADKMREKLTADWSDFIETTETRGAPTPTPPANNGGNGVTLDEFKAMGMRERSALQAKDPKRYDELSKQAKGAK